MFMIFASFRKDVMPSWPRNNPVRIPRPRVTRYSVLTASTGNLTDYQDNFMVDTFVVCEHGGKRCLVKIEETEDPHGTEPTFDRAEGGALYPHERLDRKWLLNMIYQNHSGDGIYEIPHPDDGNEN